MPWPYYAILHVGGVLFLTGIVFAVFGGAPDARRKTLMIVGGILSLLALVGGFGLAARKLMLPNPAEWPAWLWVKVGCWLWLSAAAGIAYRRRNLLQVWLAATVVAVLLGLAMAFLKPGS